jgi:proteasome activator-like protein
MSAKPGAADPADSGDMSPRLPGQGHRSVGIRGPGESGVKVARPGYRPGGLTAVMVPSRPAVVLGGLAGSPCAYRVEEPDRLLRVWGMLSAASDELHKVKLPPEAVAGLQRQLKAAIAELERSVSPALAGELDYLTRQNDTTLATASELRVEYASLLGWTGGLVIAMLDQLLQGNVGVIGQDSAADQVTTPILVTLCGALQPHLVDAGLKGAGSVWWQLGEPEEQVPDMRWLAQPQSHHASRLPPARGAASWLVGARSRRAVEDRRRHWCRR